MFCKSQLVPQITKVPNGISSGGYYIEQGGGQFGSDSENYRNQSVEMSPPRRSNTGDDDNDGNRSDDDANERLQRTTSMVWKSDISFQQQLSVTFMIKTIQQV